MVSIRVEGGEKLARTLGELPNRVNREVQRAALREAGEIIRSRASALAPREPGAPDLDDNIRMSNANPGRGDVGIAIGPTKGFFYGFFQEFGTSRHGAQPFMRPAFDGERHRVVKAITSAMWGALIRRGVGSGRASGGGVGE